MANKATTTKTLDESLLEIQSKLKAPKGLRNTFGNYSYRNTEGILEAVKPLLSEEGVTLKITDSLEAIGNRYYVKAVAILSKGSESLEVSAYAREEETKKGMDASQITGASSSYARKYALNGLFLIDDTKDADSDEYQKQSDSEKGKVQTATKPQAPLPYLNKDTKEWTTVSTAVKDGKATMEYVESKFRLSKPVKEELTSLLPKKG